MFADSWVQYPAQGIAIAILIAANAFFVATEFAFVKIRASQLKAMRRPGKRDWRLALAIRVTGHLDRYLSATQLGITLTGLGLGFVGEPVVAHWISGPLGRWGIVSATAVASISYTVAFAGIAFFEIVLGELVPKYFAIRRPASGRALGRRAAHLLLHRLLPVHLAAQPHRQPAPALDGHSADA